MVCVSLMGSIADKLPCEACCTPITQLTDVPRDFKT